MVIYTAKELMGFVQDAKAIKKNINSAIKEDKKELKTLKDKSMRKHLQHDIQRYKRMLNYVNFV